MTNQQLIDENERLKKALQKIIKLTELNPVPDTEDDIYYNPNNRREFMAAHLGRICATAEIALDPLYS